MNPSINVIINVKRKADREKKILTIGIFTISDDPVVSLRRTGAWRVAAGHSFPSRQAFRLQIYERAPSEELLKTSSESATLIITFVN